MMTSTASLTLDQFNQQVLTCQDEAFTLAVSLVADERLACAVVQEVILCLYAKGVNGTHPIALQVLQGVVLSCRQAKTAKASAAGETIPGWHQLERCEQEVLLLVDVLRKTYQDAALVLNSSERDVARSVAYGRCKLSNGFVISAD